MTGPVNPGVPWSGSGPEPAPYPPRQYTPCPADPQSAPRPAGAQGRAVTSPRYRPVPAIRTVPGLGPPAQEAWGPGTVGRGREAALRPRHARAPLEARRAPPYPRRGPSTFHKRQGVRYARGLGRRWLRRRRLAWLPERRAGHRPAGPAVKPSPEHHGASRVLRPYQPSAVSPAATKKKAAGSGTPLWS